MSMQYGEICDMPGNHEYIVFRRGQEEYGVAIGKVRKVQQLFQHETAPVSSTKPGSIQAAMSFDGISMPMIDMRVNVERGHDRAIAIVLHHADALMGVAVDNLPETVVLPPERIRAEPEMKSHLGARYVKGVGMLADRKLLVLDVEKLAEHGTGP